MPTKNRQADKEQTFQKLKSTLFLFGSSPDTRGSWPTFVIKTFMDYQGSIDEENLYLQVLYYMLKNLNHLAELPPQFFTRIQRSPPRYKLSFSRLLLSSNFQDTGLYPLLLSSLPLYTWIYSPRYSAQCA